MINLLNTIKLHASVSAIKTTDNAIYILDASYLLSVYSTDDYSAINKHLLIQEKDDRHIYDKSYAISSDFNTYASKYDDFSGILFSLNDSKLTKKDNLNFHDEAVCVSTFSHNSNLLAIGDEDGKVFFYDLIIEKLLFSFSPRADAISSISFSKNDKFTCIGSYDKSIIIYNIISNNKVAEIPLSDVVEDSIFLDDTIKIAGITRDKKLFIYSGINNKIIYADYEFDEWPTVIIKIGYNHLLIGTRGDTLYLVKSDTLEIAKAIKLQYIGVKTLAADDKSLYIGYIDGTIEVINTTYKHKEFEINLKNNKYKEATYLIEANIFLLTNKIIKKYDTVWEQVLDMAKAHLVEKNDEGALKLVTPFFFDKKKEEEYNFLNSNKNDIAHFMELVKKEKHILAFKFADEKTYLKYTKEYNEIENRFQKVYQTCKLMFDKNDLESSQKAIDTLKRYTTISSKKKQVENLITNYKDFIRVFKLVKARNFKLYHILVGKKPFLAEEELYNKVTQLGHQTYLKLLDLEQKEEFEKATTIAKYLLDFTTFKDKASQRISSIKSKIELKDYIDNDDIDAIYDAINNNNELENCKAFINYHMDFDDKRNKALQSAKDGKTNDVYVALSKYLNIDYLINSIALIFKLSYLSEMENSAKKDFDSIHWIETIARYHKIYGLDNEILSFAKEFKREDLLMQNSFNDEKQDFKNIDFYDSIIIFT